MILSISFLVFGGLIVLFNWYSLFASSRSGHHISAVPLLGGLLLALGFYGLTATQAYAWLGFVIDYGTLILIYAIPLMAWDAWTTSRFNLIHQFASDSDGRIDDFRFYKRGKFTIKSEYNPPIPGNKHGALAVSRGFVGSWREDHHGFLLKGYGEDRYLRIIKSDGGYTTKEYNYPENQEFPIDKLDSLNLKKLK